MFETSLGYDPKCGEIEIKLVSAGNGGLVCLLLCHPNLKRPLSCSCLQPINSDVKTISSFLWHSSTKDHGAIDHVP